MSPATPPSVAAIIPTYNVAAIVGRAIASAQAQTVPVAEIICADDCSSDDTRAVIARLQQDDPRIRLVALDRNGGPSVARNRAMEAATSDWVATLDADDIWRPGRIAHLLANSDGVDVVMDNVMLHDVVAGVDVRPVHAPAWETFDLDIVTYFRQASLTGFRWASLRPMMRLLSLRRAGLGYRDELRQGEDLVLIADILASGLSVRVTAEPNYVLSHRIGEESGQMNPFSRTQRDFRETARGIEAFIARHPDLSPEVRRLARACADDRLTAYALGQAREARRRGDWVGMLRQLAKPGVLSMLMATRGRRTGAGKGEGA